MKLLFATLAILAVLGFAGTAKAQNCTAQIVGNFTYTNCSPPYPANGGVDASIPLQAGRNYQPPVYQVPPMTRSTNCVSSRVGNMVYTNCQ
jgi:hypothetical protein